MRKGVFWRAIYGKMEGDLRHIAKRLIVRRLAGDVEMGCFR